DELVPGPSWSPEDLVLAALMRCTVKSLRFHAARANLEVIRASATATGHATRPEGEPRFRLVQASCALTVELAPLPPDTKLRALIDRAEHDCFVGASLVDEPRYSWTVNGSSWPGATEAG
ncbi:MAG: OsmC family protein, partial [Gaiellales bacterium]